MYNLLVSANREAWETGSYEFDLDRSIKANEYTSEEIAQKYGRFDDAAVAAIQKMPCLFAYESNNNKPARLGWLTRIRARQGKVRIDFTFDEAGVALTPQQILAMQWGLDLSDWEMNRHHWAIKDVDLFETLAEAGLIQLKKLPGTNAPPPVTQFEVRPRVFKLPTVAQDPRLVSVMMPYAGFDRVYSALETAAAAAGLHCLRADQLWEESELIQDIFSLIYRSKFVVCDFTGSNPNVFYEAGVAHTLGREVIPVTQNSADMPFDLRHHRHVRYTNDQDGLADLTQRVFSRLDYLTKNS